MDERKLVLFYNRMWHDPLSYPEDELPEGYAITEDKSLMAFAKAVVFHIPTLPPDFIQNLNLTKEKEQLWVAWSKECEVNHPQLIDPEFMDNFDLRMTYHPTSELFTPYIPHNFENIIRRPVPEKTPGNIANAFISSHINKSGRVQLLMQLMGKLEVHSYGKILNTHILDDDQGESTKLDIVSSYKFTLAFENAIAPDYVTEKFYEPLIAGSVPVYLGAPNAEDYAPGENCFIDASKWDSPNELAEYLIELSNNDDLYKEYFEWRDKPYKKAFTDIQNLMKEHEFVRLCKKIDEML